jgi:hypothetical protein
MSVLIDTKNRKKIVKENSKKIEKIILSQELGHKGR